eukprot:c15004_g1_i1.p1 GENE.c15004_g1_i1~~c15004_g1_i1.p1  ORF type:complete len:937 (-),score=240.65 c15004_g1_i1:203-3013(-)
MVKESGFDLDESFLVRVPGDNSQNDIKKSQNEKWRLACLGNRCALLCFGLTLVLFGVMIPVTIFVIVPSFAQSMMNNSQLILMNATMMNPTNETVEMNTFLEMSTPDTGMFSAIVSQTRVQLGTAKGDFGYMDMPQIQVDSSQLWINMTSTLHVTNVLLFTEATASVLQGQPEPWIIHGSPSMHLKLAGSSINFGVKLNKAFSLPKTLFVQMQASGVVIQSTELDRMTAVASSTFFSSSVLEMKNIGDMTFNVTDPTTNIWLGEVTVKDFHAVRDFNVLPVCEVVFILNEDRSNLATINQEIRNFLNGIDQKVLMVGPIRSASPFLSNIVSQTVTIVGGRLITHATASNMIITGTTQNSVLANVTSSFYSESTLSIAAVGGPQIMALVNHDGIEIGTVMLSQDVVLGFNTFSTSSVLSCKDGDQKCMSAAQDFLAKFSLGQTQSLNITGPKNPPAPFLLDVISAEIQVSGSRLMNYVTASNFAIVSTNATHMWTSCSVTFVSESPISMAAVNGYLILQMESVDGIVLGHVYIEQDVTLGLNVVNNARSLMFVSDDNVEAVRSFLRVLGSGSQQTAVLVGPIAGGSPLLYNTLRQDIQIEGALMMANVVASDIVTTGGDASHLISTSTTSFVSGMKMLKGAAGGPLSFEMKGDNEEVMGLVTVDEDIIIGMNSVASVCTLIKSDTNQQAINSFLSKFLSAIDQTITISGPVDTVIPFLSNIFSTTSLIKAELDPMVYFAVEDKDSISGYTVTVDKAKVELRGSRVTLLNPFPVPIRVRNMISDMYMQPLAYDFTLAFISHSCATSTEFTRQLTAKGMYKDNVEKDYVDLAPMTTTSFFSPSVPQDNQAKGAMCYIPGVVNLPCCFLANPVAAACRAKNVLGSDHIELSSNGTYTAEISNFVVDVSFVQSNVTVVFDEYIISGFLADGELGCSSIKLK